MLSNPTLNLQQLRVLVAVIDRGSFTKAAAQLFLSQPAVSMQIRRLEGLVNAPLLSRAGRRLVPTEVGLTVYRYAHEVLAASENLYYAVDAMTTQRLNHITVGTIPAYAVHVLPGLLARFQRAHPNLRLSLVQATGTEIIERVRQNQVDVAIVRPRHVPDDAGSVVLGADEAILFDSNRYPTAPAQTLSLEQVALLPFIRRSNGEDLTSLYLDELLAKAGLGMTNWVLTLGSWEGIKEAVRAGAGLGVTLRAVIHRELASGEFRELTIAGHRHIRDVYLLTSAHRLGQRQPPEFRELVTTLQQEFPKHSGMSPSLSPGPGDAAPAA